MIFGFRECICVLTRGEYLLDLILTDIDSNITSSTLPAISDHLCTSMCFDLQVTCQADNPREVWAFGAANWRLLKRLCQAGDWNRLDILSPSVGAVWFQERIISMMRQCIPTQRISKSIGSHPWVNERCFGLVRAKIAAANTANYSSACESCSKGFFDEYSKYAS